MKQSHSISVGLRKFSERQPGKISEALWCKIFKSLKQVGQVPPAYIAPPQALTSEAKNPGDGWPWGWIRTWKSPDPVKKRFAKKQASNYKMKSQWSQ